MRHLAKTGAATGSHCGDLSQAVAVHKVTFYWSYFQKSFRASRMVASRAPAPAGRLLLYTVAGPRQRDCKPGHRARLGHLSCPRTATLYPCVPCLFLCGRRRTRRSEPLVWPQLLRLPLPVLRVARLRPAVLLLPPHLLLLRRKVEHPLALRLPQRLEKEARVVAVRCTAAASEASAAPPPAVPRPLLAAWSYHVVG